MLMEGARYRQRAHRRDAEGSQPELQPVRVADLGLLHHVHWLRMDDTHVSHTPTNSLSKPLLTKKGTA